MLFVSLQDVYTKRPETGTCSPYLMELSQFFVSLWFCFYNNNNLLQTISPYMVSITGDLMTSVNVT